VLHVHRGHYTDPNHVRRLLALGRTTRFPPVRTGLLRSILGLRPEGPLVVQGVPTQTFITELTERRAPPRAVAGDLSPAEDVELIVGDRILYASYDYGRTQVLELDAAELSDLRSALSASGLDPDAVVSAPEYLAPQSKSADGHEGAD
jgi:hypothetical protein